MKCHIFSLLPYTDVCCHTRRLHYDCYKASLSAIAVRGTALSCTQRSLLKLCERYLMQQYDAAHPLDTANSSDYTRNNAAVSAVTVNCNAMPEALRGSSPKPGN